MTDENGAQAAPGTAQIIADLRVLIAERHRELAEVDRERERLLTEIRQYERALIPLTGEPRKTQRGSTTRIRPNLGDERYKTICDAVLAYAADHEEFRQVDVRGTLAGQLARSGTVATAFERMRQDNLIRFARRDGISKYYRLANNARTQAQA